MSEMDVDTDDSDSTFFSSHNEVNDNENANANEEKQEEEDEDEEQRSAESSDDDGWTYPKNKIYQPYIVSFMSFTHNRTYPKNAEFTKQQLLSIKPHHVKKWLNKLAYNTATPTENDRPLHKRSGTSDVVLKRQSKLFLSSTQTSMSHGWKAEGETQQFIRP
jgi:hypothetical protein